MPQSTNCGANLCLGYMLPRRDREGAVFQPQVTQQRLVNSIWMSLGIPSKFYETKTLVAKEIQTGTATAENCGCGVGHSACKLSSILDINH